MVELAIAAPVFLLIVFGVIQLGLALNFWLDMQRIANQGARWAAVNRYPGCTTGDVPCDPTLQEYLVSEEIADALNATVRICFPADPTPSGGAYTGKSGDPVTVRVQRPYSVSIIGFDINLRAEATMRLEQTPTRFERDPAPSC